MTTPACDADTPRAVEADDLRLEPQVAAHATEMFAVLRDPAIYEYENEPPASAEVLRQRFAALESHRSPSGRELWLNWVVRVPGEGLIGYVQATVDQDRRATIAYEFGSRWWGRGFGRRAVEAMLGELAAQHGVRHCAAVLKQENLRSFYLLRRLRFTAATPAQHAARGVERDEWLMQRDLGPRR
jgi:[ribosomal protein S5]-alanine N-acetyltransferase